MWLWHNMVLPRNKMINNKVYLIILHLINIFYFRACFRLRPTQLKMEHLEKCDFFSCWKKLERACGAVVHSGHDLHDIQQIQMQMQIQIRNQLGEGLEHHSYQISVAPG